MSYALSPVVKAVMSSPVTQAQAWLQGRKFPTAKPLLDIAQAAPGYPPADELNAYLAEQLRRPELSRYTGNFGIPELRAALAEHMQDAYGGDISAQQVTITAGCNQGFCTVVPALAAPGDEVMLPLPYYFNHQMWLELQGIRAVQLPFRDDALPDPVAAAQLISPRTRAIALVTPNNPTGAVYPPDLLAAFYELAERHGCALILDETYKDFNEAPGPAHDLFQRPNWPEVLIQLYSFSKAYSLPGYRVGSVISSTALIEQMAKIIDCVTICPSRIGQEAALFGLQHLSAWVADKRQLMAQRRQALIDAFAAQDCGYQIVSSGAYFAYIRHPWPERSSVEVAQSLLEQQHILCLPGAYFGPGQERYLRFAFANLDAEQMPQLVTRLHASQS